jgi:hypothetical protein
MEVRNQIIGKNGKILSRIAFILGIILKMEMQGKIHDTRR